MYNQGANNRTFQFFPYGIVFLVVGFLSILPQSARAAKTETFNFDNGSVQQFTVRGEVPWALTSMDTYNGSPYSAKSGAVNGTVRFSTLLQETTILELNVQVADPGGTLEFVLKMAQPDDQAELSLVIDGSNKGGWSNKSDWKKSGKINLGSGLHRIRWVYRVGYRRGDAAYNYAALVDDIVITNVERVLPSVSRRLWGYAWASTIGWIHFGEKSGGAIPPSGPYVTYTPDDQKLSGYAWSPNIGWVNSHTSVNWAASASPQNTVDITDTTLTGFALVRSFRDAISDFALSSGSPVGASGLVSWSGTATNGAPYGVRVNVPLMQSNVIPLTGYAWSQEFGWIQFDPKFGGVSIERGALANAPPVKPTLTNPIGDRDLYTIPGWETDPVTPHFEWSAFSDADAGDVQTAYEIEIQGVAQRHVSNASTCLYRGFDPCFGVSALDLAWNTQYKWRVRVFDRVNEASPWSNEGLFRTPNHRRPIADFTLPNQPKANMNLQFVEQSSCYQFSAPTSPVPCRTLSGITYQWNFGDCTVSSSTCTSTQRDPSYKYSRAGVYVVTLTVTDQDGYVSAPKQQQITIGQALPGWERITPF